MGLKSPGELPARLLESVGQILGQAAHAEVGWGQSGAADPLEQKKDLVAFAQGVEERRHGPDVVGMRAQPEKVAGNPLEFAENDPDRLGPRWRLDPEELLHGQHIGQVVRHACHVIEAVRKRQALVVRPVFGKLFDAPVQKADIRRGLDDHFSIQFQNDTQNPMGARMLGSHVDDHGFLTCHVFPPTPRSG